jgi:UDP:flavonoid glycosyltransferase YjiC (YdhE family)
MVMYPQHSEELAITNRAIELGTGVKLKGTNSKGIRDSVFEILDNPSYRENALKLSESLKRSGGAKSGADFVESIVNQNSIKGVIS